MTIVHNEDKRKQERKKIEKGFVEIPLTYPCGHKLIGEIVDSSRSGLSFIMPSAQGYLLPGTPLKDFIVRLNGDIQEVSYAEVVHFTQAKEEHVKIGIKFRGSPYKSKKKNFKFRTTRYYVTEDLHVKGTVSFYLNDNYLEGKVLDLSRFGSAFELSSQESVLRIGNTLNNMRINLNDEIVYEGECTITSVREEYDKLIIGVSLKDKWLELEKINGIRRKDIIEGDLLRILDMSKITVIDPQFKTYISDMHYVFCEIKSRLDEEELWIKRDPAGKRDYSEKYILEVSKKILKERLDELFLSLNEIYINNAKVRDDSHRDYFQKQLNAFFMLSPFLHRAYHKPLGYSGDYGLMVKVFEDQYEGDSIFAKSLNKYTLEISAAQANRNRVKYLTDLLKRSYDTSGKTFNFTSIASGPCLEIQQFLKYNIVTKQCNVTLIDFEKEALEYSSQELWNFKSSLGPLLNMNFYEMPVIDVIHELRNNKNSLIENQDLIYVSGLFEYLTDGMCRKIIKILTQYVRPGGCLMFGNYDPSNPFRAYMDLATEWFLIYRDKKKFIELADDLDVRDCYCDSEEHGINNFLIIEK